MQLCYGNYEWWWRTFAIGASGGMYLAVFGAVYWAFYMDIAVIGFDMIYLVYLYMYVVLFSMMGGSIACMSGYIFVESIYRGIKFD